jgi:hypothetical protein
MDGKFILLFIICCSIISGSLSFTCVSSGATCGDSISGNALVQFLAIDPLQNWGKASGIELSGNFSSEIDGMLQPQASGVGIFEGIGLLLDGLKIIFTMLTFLTPFPILLFANSLGMPFWLNLSIFGPIMLLYVISLMEIIVGRKF